MIPDILPIITTKVDWTFFLAGADKALSRSVSASLDAKGLAAVGPAAFICGTKEFKQKNSDAIQAFREYSNLHHVYVGFLIICDKDTFCELPTKHISYTMSEATDGLAFIASGSLYDWYFFLLSILTESASKNTRLLGMKLLLWMECNDFGACWVDYSKETLPDKTYFLKAK